MARSFQMTVQNCFDCIWGDNMEYECNYEGDPPNAKKFEEDEIPEDCPVLVDQEIVPLPQGVPMSAFTLTEDEMKVSSPLRWKS